MQTATCVGVGGREQVIALGVPEGLGPSQGWVGDLSLPEDTAWEQDLVLHLV